MKRHEVEMFYKQNVDDYPILGLEFKIVYRNISGRVIARILRHQ